MTQIKSKNICVNHENLRPIFIQKDCAMKQITILLTLLALLLAACGGRGDNEHSSDDRGHDNNSQEANDGRVPNNGAAVRIVSPANGDSFSQHDQIIVEIAVENFVVGEDGNHWHIYANGVSQGMIMGQTTEYVLRGLAPGSYTLDVYLAGGDHRDLEDGDSVAIMVTE
jgi:hypothetical protein